ncbi:hypothetical protein ABPG77_003424 [Micractinium sp. CCAP 211/92]
MSAVLCGAFLLLAGLAAGQGLPPGCNPDSVGEQLAQLGLSLDENATWTGPVRRAEAQDVDFAFYEFGNASGPTVVSINGFGTTMAEWGPILPQLLAQDSRVFMFDNPGQGLSIDYSNKPLTIERMAAATVALLDEAGINGKGASKPVLLGWSMGGMVALSMAQQQTDKWSGLVLVDTAAGGPDMVYPDAATVEALTCCNGTEANQVLFNYSSPSGLAGACTFDVGAGWMSLALGEGYPNATTSAAQAEAAYAFEQSNGTYTALPSITLPTLVVTGSDDLVIPPENAQTLADRLPNAQLYEIPDAGHGAWAQDTAQFALRVQQFLSSPEGPAGPPAAPPPEATPTRASAALPACGGLSLASAALVITMALLL